MKKDNAYKKYIIMITYTIFLLFVMINLKEILGFLGRILKVLSPLWLGIAFAFVLNVPMMNIEKKVFGHTNKKIRITSVTLSIMIVLLLLIILFAWVLPDFIESASYLLGQVPSLLEKLNELLIDAFKNTELAGYLKNFSASSGVANITSDIVKTLINNFTGILSNFASTVVNVITGLIIAVYFLLEKEHILKTSKKMLEKLLPEKAAHRFYEVVELANKSFHDFITYQCLECLILGTIMFFAFVLFRFPYALTIAFLTTVTAIVPIFGAFTACFIGVILIGTVSIEKAIIFVIVFQVIQQIENNIIYPRIVGKHVGLPPVVTIIALLVGGNLAGLPGMILCIPITSILISLFWGKIEEDDKKVVRKRSVKRKII